MDMCILTFILGAIFGALFLIPRAMLSGNAKAAQTTASTKLLSWASDHIFLDSEDRTRAMVPRCMSTTKLYTKAEVSCHNTRTDCWIIIKDKVYDVTPYVEEHPGGDAILAHAGDDSTEGFYGPQHATRVFDMVDEFYVGDLKH